MNQELVLRPVTMKQQLHLMIAKHGLHELLERLMELVEDEAEVRDSHQLQRVAVHLQDARSDSLMAAHHQWE